MNIAKKLYCRSFQTLFRIALPFLPYRDPYILNKIKNINEILLQNKLSKPLLITDKIIRDLGLTEALEKQLLENGIKISIYDETEQNPTTDMVNKAFDYYIENNCDSIIAFGGGSPIDCAKAVGARVAYPKKKLKKMAGIMKVLKKTPTIIAVPTTAGTGSETTLAAVIVDSNTRHKYVINSFPLIPAYAVLDPVTIHSLPAKVTAATGMDALTHAVEAYIGRSTTKQTRRDAEEAVRLIFSNIEKTTRHESVKAEANMLRASHLAGRAFTRSYVGYIHAVSHSLSGKYNMPHGLTNAVLLPIVLEMYGNVVYKKLAKLAICAGVGTPNESDEKLAKHFIKEIYAMNERLGIPKKLEGIKEEDIDELSAYANKEGNPLYPVPVLWDREELKEVYRKAMMQL